MYKKHSVFIYDKKSFEFSNAHYRKLYVKKGMNIFPGLPSMQARTKFESSSEHVSNELKPNRLLLHKHSVIYWLLHLSNKAANSIMYIPFLKCKQEKDK